MHDEDALNPLSRCLQYDVQNGLTTPCKHFGYARKWVEYVLIMSCKRFYYALKMHLLCSKNGLLCSKNAFIML